MKIAFLNYYQSGVRRGIETFVKELADRLSQHHSVLILPAPAATSPASTRLSLLRRFFLDKNSLKVGFWTLRSLAVLHKFQPNLVFSLNGGWQVLILRLWCSLNKTKLIVSAQSGPGWDDRWNLFCHPDVFVCLTQAQLHWASKAFHWPGQRFATIGNGVDLDKFSPAGKKKKMVLEKPIILIVAATEPAKRVEQGIQAIAKLNHASLLLLGQGPLDERIDKLGYKLLGQSHFLHLSVPHPSMPAYYRSAQLFTLCSQSSEAFGIVYLEALASGLACVATDDASRREIVGTAGIFVKDPHDVKEYAAALETALAKNWNNLPRRQALVFSWDKISHRYETLFQNL